MTSNIEEAILAFLVTQLDAEDVTYGLRENAITVMAATINGQKVGLYAVTADNAVAENWAAIIIKASDEKTEVGNLKTCNLEISISTPRNSTAYTATSHRAILAAVRDEMVLANLGAIEDELEQFEIVSCNGWFAAGEPDQHTAGRWMTTLQFDPFAFTV
jgi:hypothetical protein